MKIGIITAMAEETLPIYKKIGNVVEEFVISSVEIRQIETKNHTLFLATSGIGEIRAALATQVLIDKFNIDAIFNFGFVGAINNKLDVTELVLVEKVCHHQFNISAVCNTKIGQYDDKESQFFKMDKNLLQVADDATGGRLKKVTVASGDKFIAARSDKIFLSEVFGADICEMELAAIAIAAERSGLPALSIKIVSDKADEKAVVTFATVLEKGITKYEEVLQVILKSLE